MSTLIRRLIERKWEKNSIRDAVRLACEPLPPGVETVSGLDYLPDGHPMHTLNLYRPEGISGPLPTVVDIHGGGWMYGDRNLNRAYGMYLASQGYAVMGMSYRLLPETDLRGQIQDIFASLRWLGERGERYGFDLSRILLTGDSAGGHLAALAACIQCSPELQGLYGVEPLPYAFRALAIAHGVCDLYHFSFLPAPLDGMVSREYRNLLLGRPWRRSPLRGYASFAETAPGLSLPPIFVIASEPDRYYAQSRSLLNWLAASGLEYESVLWTKTQGEHLTHVFEVSHWDWPESRETNDRMLAFFRRTWETPELER